MSEHTTGETAGETAGEDVEDVQWARDYVHRRIEECQWRILLSRLDGLHEPEPEDTTFLGSIGSSSRREPRFCGVLWLGDPDTTYPRESSYQNTPPMPLTARNRKRLETMGFVVLEGGYWAVFGDK